MVYMVIDLFKCTALVAMLKTHKFIHSTLKKQRFFTKL